MFRPSIAVRGKGISLTGQQMFYCRESGKHVKMWLTRLNIIRLAKTAFAAGI